MATAEALLIPGMGELVTDIQRFFCRAIDESRDPCDEIICQHGASPAVMVDTSMVGATSCDAGAVC
jgi:hypothetical protein